MRVLLVEDDDGDAEIVRDALHERTSSEVQLTRVVRLHEARLRLTSERFDVVLLDLSLPDARGLDGLHALHAAVPGVPIVVLTSAADPAVDARALSEGAQDYLEKSRVSSAELVRAIRIAREAERFRSRTRLLDEVAVALAEGVDAATMLDGFVAAVTRSFADRCLLDGLTAFDWEQGHGTLTVAPPGISRLYTSLLGAAPGQASDRVRLETLHEPHIQSAMVVPFLVNDEESGALVLGRLTSSLPYVPEDLVLAEEIARTALAALTRVSSLPGFGR